MTAAWLLQRLGGATTAHADQADAERTATALRPAVSVAWLCEGIEDESEGLG